MPLTPQRLKDHCLIIVGDGGEADRILAKRRLAAGGRLAHFQTEGPEDDRVRQQALMDDVSSEYFTWQPPSQKMPISSFAKKQLGKARSFWTKIGPDGVEVQPGQKLKLMAGVDGKPKHLELWDGEKLLVQMSGEIVLDVSKAEAKTYDVEVYNPELKAFGTVSWRFVLIAIPMQFFYQMAKFLLSIELENRAVEGQVPWFRGLMTVFEACVGLSVCVEMWSWSLNVAPDWCTANNLAMALRAEGKASEAAMLYTEIVEVMKEVFGPEDPDTLATASNLGLALLEQDRLTGRLMKNLLTSR
eukprot:Skav229016  [mRNA]  locus=scaffold127:483024:490587:- [translate_table: standard]